MVHLILAASLLLTSGTAFAQAQQQLDPLREALILRVNELTSQLVLAQAAAIEAQRKVVDLEAASKKQDTDTKSK